MESINKEKDKLVLMGTINSSKDQALAAQDSKNSKGKKNANPKKPRNLNKEKQKPREEFSSSKKNP